MSSLPPLLLASCCALAALLRPQTPAPLQLECLHAFTLPNGLHVILHEDHSVPIVSVNVWYHVGSANESARAAPASRTCSST